MPTKNPRLNVTVTPEQHSLLLQLARINGGSAAGYLRQMLDEATPLLRATVPTLREAAQQIEMTKVEAGATLKALMQAITETGVVTPTDLIDIADDVARPGKDRTERSDGGLAKSGHSS